ncbi:uncharacterized protein LOC115759246 [Drosophila novamexicana]|uniref:uncharacterized protein LOC115759246 n=1 Tax=Drosophila novamexicana TaxID=47314 RepID=UPI0011E5FE11|nr:uncharacterized protein LOC115759246 [Drosophila novamexicana]
MNTEINSSATADGEPNLKINRGSYTSEINENAQTWNRKNRQETTWDDAGGRGSKLGKVKLARTRPVTRGRPNWMRDPFGRTQIIQNLIIMIPIGILLADRVLEFIFAK